MVVVLIWHLKGYFLIMKIASGSMAPAMLPGDYILAFSSGCCSYDQIAVFTHPYDPERKIAKRCIGTPGDELKITNNGVTRNKADLSSDHIIVPSQNDTIKQEKIRSTLFQDVVEKDGGDVKVSGGKHVVSQDYYYFLSDRLQIKTDSRTFGMVPEENVIGYGLLIIASKDPETDSYRNGRFLTRIEPSGLLAEN